MTELDSNGQPIETSYNSARNQEKSLNDLLGVLQGIVADQQINHQEALFLDTWLRNNEYLKDDPDGFDLLDLTGDILSDGIATQEELGELKDLVSCVLDYHPNNNRVLDSTREVQQLLGVFKGVTADRVLNQQELTVLAELIEACNSLKMNPAFKKIRHKFKWAVDKKSGLNQAEHDELVQLLSGIAGADVDSGVTGGLSIGLDFDFPTIQFENRGFCLTAKFSYGTRNDCKQAIKKRGGVTQPRIIRATDYLVIGNLASRDWKYSSYGLKIQDALEKRESGYAVKIVSETHFVEALRLSK